MQGLAPLINPRYIGIPFLTHGRTWHGCDCWGIVRLFYECEKGIELPALTGYTDTADSQSISQIISEEKSDWIQTNTPKQGDVVVLKIAGRETHVGIYLSKNRFLHCFKGLNSCIEKLNNPKWVNRISGVYRYAG